MRASVKVFIIQMKEVYPPGGGATAKMLELFEKNKGVAANGVRFYICVTWTAFVLLSPSTFTAYELDLGYLIRMHCMGISGI